jgi:hypothetical protein
MRAGWCNFCLSPYRSVGITQIERRELNSSDVAEITLIRPGTFWFFHRWCVDGGHEKVREQLEVILSEHGMQGERDVCNVLAVFYWITPLSRMNISDRSARILYKS